MLIKQYPASEVSRETFTCLRASGMLVHHERCYEDARSVPLEAFAQALDQTEFVQVCRATEAGPVLGFSAASIGQAAGGSVGRIHFFVVRPDASLEVASALLDRALAWFESAKVAHVRQSRLDPVSSVLRVEQDRHLIDLLLSRGLAPGSVAGNMQIDMAQFGWTNKLRAQAEAVQAAGITVRHARLEDVLAVRTLDAQEGLALWDYHVDAMLAANAIGRLLVAEQNSTLVGYSNFLAARWDSDLTEFGPLLVASNVRGLGLGSVLMAQALDFAREHARQRVRLSTLRFDFYRALGFQVTVTWRESMERG
jgi:GNAT superfamily N-acetyltransferase